MAKERIIDDGKHELATKYDFDEWYAEAWSRRQGYFSTTLANNLIKYLKEGNRDINSALDICSGSGEFISILKNVVSECMGVDNALGYINYVKNRYHDITFEYVKQLYDFKLKRTFDLVSCNRDVVNMFNNFDEWQKFFKTAHKLLNKNGYFLFDFYTQKKLNGWEEVIYEQAENLDYVSKVSRHETKTVFNEVYYIKQSTEYYRRTGDIMVEEAFPTDQILDALQKAGFGDIKLLNIDFSQIAEPQNADRIFVLARKK